MLRYPRPGEALANNRRTRACAKLRGKVFTCLLANRRQRAIVAMAPPAKFALAPKTRFRLMREWSLAATPTPPSAKLTPFKYLVKISDGLIRLDLPLP